MLVKDSSAFVSPFFPGRFSNYDSLIRTYEQTGDLSSADLDEFEKDCIKLTDPTNYVSNLYEARSLCRVRHAPLFAGVKVSASLIAELTTDESLYLGWIGPVLALPFAAVYDIVKLPIQATQTAFVSQDDIDAALEDLAAARRLGNDHDHASRSMFGWPSTHLDRLGYRSSRNPTDTEHPSEKESP